MTDLFLLGEALRFGDAFLAGAFLAGYALRFVEPLRFLPPWIVVLSVSVILWKKINYVGLYF